jgi:hypothetical protein
MSRPGMERSGMEGRVLVFTLRINRNVRRYVRTIFCPAKLVLSLNFYFSNDDEQSRTSRQVVALTPKYIKARSAYPQTAQSRACA